MTREKAKLPSIDTEKYQPLRLIHTGGMGQVYEGRIKYPMGEERPCAIKVVRPDLTHDLKCLQWFAKEAFTGLDITHNHPNLITTRDVGMTTEGHLFIIMDLVKGPRLNDIREQLRGEYARIRRIACDVLSALRYLRKCNLAHGDISPKNILLSTDGLVMLCDLGVVVREGSAGTEPHFGNPPYMSPEKRKRLAVTHESDLYSLGVVLCELVTGDLPSCGEPPGRTDVELSFPPDTPQTLAMVITGLLRHKPSDRMTAQEALSILKGDSQKPASTAYMTALAALASASAQASDSRASSASHSERSRPPITERVLDDMVAKHYLRLPTGTKPEAPTRPRAAAWLLVASLLALLAVLVTQYLVLSSLRTEVASPAPLQPQGPTTVGPQSPTIAGADQGSQEPITVAASPETIAQQPSHPAKLPSSTRETNRAIPLRTAIRKSKDPGDGRALVRTSYSPTLSYQPHEGEILWESR